MEVCVTSGAPGLDAPADLRFGRCPFFVVVDMDNATVESIANRSAEEGNGAGIQTAQAIAGLGLAAQITGDVGPNALQTLSAADIGVYKHHGGTVRDVVEQFQRGELPKIITLSAPPHMGMGRRGGPKGRGRDGFGGGRGQGAGQGRSSDNIRGR
jgi:predicted Fe-Mo cluster-binding NifX family protein